MIILHNSTISLIVIRFFILSFIIAKNSFLGFSQERMNLNDCLSRSFLHSKEIAMVKVKRSSADTYLRQERDLFIPSLSITNQHNLSIGRVLDPTTYQFITNRTVHDMSAYIGGSLTLFSGLERLYQVKKAELGLRSVELDEARTKNELSLEVTRLFLKQTAI